MMRHSKAGGDRTHHSRALVLGGGGPVGRAWEIGLVEGFARQEIDLGSADIIVGTSAGAMVGALLALKQRFGAPNKREASASASPPVSSSGMAALTAAMVRAALSPAPELVRMEIGNMALEAHTVSEEVSLSRSMLAPLVGQAWPDRFRATTVNVRTGQFQVWDASLGAPLERAVAASMAVPGISPPITINGERYMDGGVRSMLNADLAIGFDLVIAVSCFALTADDGAENSPFAATNASSLAELDAVRNSGATLAVIKPDSDFLALTNRGAAMMDNSLVPEAYRLGQMKAFVEAESVRKVWSSY
jgi:NTE family protein